MMVLLRHRCRRRFCLLFFGSILTHLLQQSLLFWNGYSSPSSSSSLWMVVVSSFNIQSISSSSSTRPSNVINRFHQTVMKPKRFITTISKNQQPLWNHIIITASTTTTTTFLSSSSSFDYEFLPFNNNEDDDDDDDENDEDANVERRKSLMARNNNNNHHHLSHLTSSYPPSTPAGLRGEAVRSALLSDTRCVVWKHHSSTDGLVQLTGPGVISFLQAKLTKSFQDHTTIVDRMATNTPTNNNNNNERTTTSITPSSSSMLYFTPACLLNAKGQVVDALSVAVTPVITMEQEMDTFTTNNKQKSVTTTTDGRNNNGKKDSKRNYRSWWLTSMRHVNDKHNNDDDDDDDDRSSPTTTTTTTTTTKTLVQDLKDLIFPLDQVEVEHVSCPIITLASTQRSVVQQVIQTQVLPFLHQQQHGGGDDNNNNNNNEPFIFSQRRDQAQMIEYGSTTPSSSSSSGLRLLLLPTTGLPSCYCVGYTLCLFGGSSSSSSSSSVGEELWNYLTNDDTNPNGPIAVGSLEYESLRIQAGQPALGWEYQASLRLANNNKKKKKQRNVQGENDDSVSEDDSGTTTTTSSHKQQQQQQQLSNIMIPPSPLELHMQNVYLDLDHKEGCYLGQEGLASILKNPRGPPRTLYQVVFDDETNVYDNSSPQEQEQQKRRRKHDDNLTRYPRVGDRLYVLGSNEQIWVGTITSVAEPNGTGEANTVALCLVRRADSIVSSTKEMGLEMVDAWSDELEEREKNNNNIGYMAPPPMDPLHGLEVKVGGTYTMGRLQSIPSRRVGPSSSSYDGPNWLEQEYQKSRNGISTSRTNKNDDDDDDAWINIERTQSRMGNAEWLEQRTRMSYASPTTTAPITTTATRIISNPIAEPVQRSQWEDDDDDDNEKVPDDDDDEASYQQAMEEAAQAQKQAEAAAAEAKRKAEKMELLKKRAEEAMAKRKQIKPSSSSSSPPPQ